MLTSQRLTKLKGALSIYLFWSRPRPYGPFISAIYKMEGKYEKVWKK